MPTVYALLPDTKQQFLDSSGDPLSGGKLFIYTAGSSTKATTYTESDGITSNANPIVLDSRGETGNGVYVATGTYKLVLAPSTDTDPPASAIWTRDNVTPINDVTAGSVSEWVSGPTPTYVSGTQFTLVGDQTTDFHVGRRLKLTDSGGTDYATITATSYSDPNTTVTFSVDSGTVDSGLSAVSYGLISADNPSDRPALGSAVQVLATDTTAAYQQYAKWGGRLITSGTSTTVANLAFTDLLAAYGSYLLLLEDVILATDAANFVIQTSTDNGSSFTSAAGSYAYAFTQSVVSGSPSVTGSNSATGIIFASAMGSAAGESGGGRIWIHAPMVSGANTKVGVDFAYFNSSGNYLTINGGAERKNNEQNDAFQLIASSGNIETITYALFGFPT